MLSTSFSRSLAGTTATTFMQTEAFDQSPAKSSRCLRLSEILSLTATRLPLCMDCALYGRTRMPKKTGDAVAVSSGKQVGHGALRSQFDLLAVSIWMSGLTYRIGR